MKKFLLVGAALIASSLPLSGLATNFGHCPTNISVKDFCGCFIKSCMNNFPAGECNYNMLTHFIMSNGVERTCRAQGSSANLKECEDGINHFIDACQGY